MGPMRSAPNPACQLPLDTITELLKQKLSSVMQNIIESGDLLLEAKNLLGHGKFCLWLRENFKMSPKSANRFMSVALMVRQRQLQRDAVEQIMSLDLKSLYELSSRSTPVPVQEQIFSDIKAGKLVSYTYIKTLKKQFNSHHATGSASDTDITALLPDLGVFVQGIDKYIQIKLVGVPQLERRSRTELLLFADKLRQAGDQLERILTDINDITAVKSE